MTHPRLSIRATPRQFYGEHDELEIYVELAGVSLAGSASVFADHHVLGDIEEQLRGFPSTVGDQKALTVGIFNRLLLNFGTTTTGLVTVHASLSIYGSPTDSESEILTVRFCCDPSAIDSFCDELQTFIPDIEAEANLVGRSTQ